MLVQDAEYMEQKKSQRESRGNSAWQPQQARQQELDEADRFQVLCYLPSLQLVPLAFRFGLYVGLQPPSVQASLLVIVCTILSDELTW